MTATTIKAMLLLAPDSQLDASVFPLIEKWDEPEATSLQLLEVLDPCVYYSLASGFTVTLLQNLYAEALKREGKTHEENIPLAVWRNLPS